MRQMQGTRSSFDQLVPGWWVALVATPGGRRLREVVEAGSKPEAAAAAKSQVAARLLHDEINLEVLITRPATVVEVRRGRLRRVETVEFGEGLGAQVL